VAAELRLPTEPISAPIEALGWIVGSWQGGDGANHYEEWWAEPSGGMMIGMFRWLRDGAPRFYELMTIEPEDGRPVWRIKHFGPGLVGWEERDAAVTLDLVALDGEQATFLKRGETRWMIYRRDPGGELVAWFETEGVEREPGDEFRYARR
jgi:hypothetical protein